MAHTSVLGTVYTILPAAEAGTRGSSWLPEPSHEHWMGAGRSPGPASWLSEQHTLATCLRGPGVPALRLREQLHLECVSQVVRLKVDQGQYTHHPPKNEFLPGGSPALPGCPCFQGTGSSGCGSANFVSLRTHPTPAAYLVFSLGLRGLERRSWHLNPDQSFSSLGAPLTQSVYLRSKGRYTAGVRGSETQEASAAQGHSS